MTEPRILRDPDSADEGGAPPTGAGTSARPERASGQANAPAGGERTAPDSAEAATPLPADPIIEGARLETLLQAREAVFAREMAARDQKAKELEQAYRAALRDRELATALVGKPLIPGAATQLIKLWREDFDVVDERGEYRVVARDGRSAAQAVSEWLNSPEYAHFCQSSTRGGTASPGGSRPLAPAAAVTAPKNLGEAIVVQWQKASRRAPESGGPVGLGRRH